MKAAGDSNEFVFILQAFDRSCPFLLQTSGGWTYQKPPDRVAAVIQAMPCALPYRGPLTWGWSFTSS